MEFSSTTLFQSYSYTCLSHHRMLLFLQVIGPIELNKIQLSASYRMVFRALFNSKNWHQTIRKSSTGRTSAWAANRPHSFSISHKPDHMATKLERSCSPKNLSSHDRAVVLSAVLRRSTNGVLQHRALATGKRSWTQVGKQHGRFGGE